MKNVSIEEELEGIAPYEVMNRSSPEVWLEVLSNKDKEKHKQLLMNQ